MCVLRVCFFFFNDTATTEIYTLSLHDALPIWLPVRRRYIVKRALLLLLCAALPAAVVPGPRGPEDESVFVRDRKSTRLNSSHSQISYAVFCLKKKKN